MLFSYLVFSLTIEFIIGYQSVLKRHRSKRMQLAVTMPVHPIVATSKYKSMVSTRERAKTTTPKMILIASMTKCSEVLTRSAAQTRSKTKILM